MEIADRGVNTFSPEGRLFQVEYAIEAIKLGSTTIGISTPEGVVLGVEKRVQSKLLEATSIEKIMEIDSHLGCAMSGLTADARTMIEHARVTSQVRERRTMTCKYITELIHITTRIMPLRMMKRSKYQVSHKLSAIWHYDLVNPLQMTTQ